MYIVNLLIGDPQMAIKMGLQIESVSKRSDLWGMLLILITNYCKFTEFDLGDLRGRCQIGYFAI